MNKNDLYKFQVESIPYQLCPKCQGLGVAKTWLSTTSTTELCDVCNGQKIIPMYYIIIDENGKIQKQASISN